MPGIDSDVGRLVTRQWLRVVIEAIFLAFLAIYVRMETTFKTLSSDKVSSTVANTRLRDGETDN
jgi:hypothetical protein